MAWNSIKLEFENKTSMSNPAESLGYGLISRGDQQAYYLFIYLFVFLLIKTLLTTERVPTGR